MEKTTVKLLAVLMTLTAGFILAVYVNTSEGEATVPPISAMSFNNTNISNHDQKHAVAYKSIFGDKANANTSNSTNSRASPAAKIKRSAKAMGTVSSHFKYASMFLSELSCSVVKPRKFAKFKPTTKADTKTEKKKKIVVINGLVEPNPNTEKLQYVDHTYYKSALIGNMTYFNKLWDNATNASRVIRLHPQQSYTTRSSGFSDIAFKMRLPFPFRYYGHELKAITVSTAGYLFTGPLDQRYRAKVQSISPLMAHWDLTLYVDSNVIVFEHDNEITFVWENVAVERKKQLKFTFGVTLFKNGDIFFMYKDIPLKVQDIDDKHTVFVGLADSYFTNQIKFVVRRQVVHNYSQIPFLSYDLKNGTVLQLIPLPSCPMYTDCKTCINHMKTHGSFDCSWCSSLRKCTSGADFFRPDVTGGHNFKSYISIFRALLPSSSDIWMS